MSTFVKSAVQLAASELGAYRRHDSTEASTQFIGLFEFERKTYVTGGVFRSRIKSTTKRYDRVDHNLTDLFRVREPHVTISEPRSSWNTLKSVLTSYKQ